MALINCPECRTHISDQALACPQCGYPLKPTAQATPARRAWHGYEWKSDLEILGIPFIHIAFGRNRKTGKILVARGIIAIGQFGIGLITIAQFGLGLLFGFGQFLAGFTTIGQVALGIYFGLGQVATGLTAIGQLGVGKYVLAQAGFGEFVWSVYVKNPQAIEYFNNLYHSLTSFF